MKKIVLVAALLITAIGFGQNNTRPISNVITTTVNESIEISPSHYTILLSLSEKVNIDEETQVTKPITMDMILKRLVEKMAPYDLEERDLELYSFSESTSATIMNGYNAYNNYSASKKKLLSRLYQLTWMKDVSALETFLSSLRFNGFEMAQIIPEYSESLIADAKKRLLEKALATAKQNATIMAEVSGIKIGNVQAIYEGDLISENMNYPYYNYNNGYANVAANGTSIFVIGNTIKSREETVSLTVSYSIKTE
ncbi:MAG: DUF541 domain-containing protein [Crocinitomix sp.]|nr:DUF541 domain-containing protein [Crocinitomix sp.]